MDLVWVGLAAIVVVVGWGIFRNKKSPEAGGPLKAGRTATKEALIQYEDATGKASQRRITLHDVVKEPGGQLYLKAFCHLRNDERTFRIDRIRSLIDQNSGTTLTRLADILSWARSPAVPAERNAEGTDQTSKLLKPATPEAELSPALEAAGEKRTERLIRHAAFLGLPRRDSVDDEENEQIDGAKVDPVAFHMTYVDAYGRESDRILTIKTIENQGSESSVFMVGGYCHMRKGPRCFRSDRIVRLVDLATGEVAESQPEIENWLIQLRKPINNSIREFATILGFLAGVDESISDDEVDLMISGLSEISQMPEGAHRALRKRLKRFAPTVDQAIEAARTIGLQADDTSVFDRLRGVALRLIEADGAIDPREEQALSALVQQMETAHRARR